MTIVLHAIRSAFYTGIMLLIIGVGNVRDMPLFMFFLAVLFITRFLETSRPGAASLASGLKGEDQSRLTTWILSASFLSNMVLPILHYRYSDPPLGMGWWNWLGLVAFIAGSALRLWSMWTAGESFKANVAVSAKQRLAQHGPYAWVRHPAYVGLVVLYLGVAAVFSSSWGLAALVIIVAPALVVHLLKEEKMLAAHFGEEWRQYTAQTGVRLIPGLW